MEQYISKSALVAEIDRQKIGYNVDGKHSVEYDTTRKILNIIDTLETKEVDLDKEIDKVKKMQRNFKLKNDTIIEFCAKHFFELGLNTQKGET